MLIKERKGSLDNDRSGFAFWLMAEQFGTALTRKAESCNEGSWIWRFRNQWFIEFRQASSNASSQLGSRHVKALHATEHHLRRALGGRGMWQHFAGAEDSGSAGWQEEAEGLHWWNPMFLLVYVTTISQIVFALSPSILRPDPVHTWMKRLLTTGVCCVKCLCIWITYAFGSSFFYPTQISSILPHWVLLVCFSLELTLETYL